LGRQESRKAELLIAYYCFDQHTTNTWVSRHVKEKLLKVASKLQEARGHPVDFSEAINFLIYQRENVGLLEEACKPMVRANGGSKNCKLNENVTSVDLKGESAIGSRMRIKHFLCS
jgi:hypothetical protein